MFEVKLGNTHGCTSAHVYHKSVSIVDGAYGHYKQNKDDLIWIPCGRAVYVDSVVTDIDTCEQYLNVHFDLEDGMRRDFTYPRAWLTESKIEKLIAIGCQVTKQSVQFLIKSIENQEVNAEKKYVHSLIGFGEFQGKKIFKGANAIGVRSTLKDKFRIAPCGDFEVWKQMVSKEVLGLIPLEFVLTCGICGVIIDFLKEKVILGNLCVHLVGESSCGKTTSALLALSCGSAPDMFGNNCVMNFSDTPNSLMRAMKDSYTCLVDEGSLLNCERDTTQMLYALSCGIEKKRCAQDKGLKEGVQFHTAIIMTSEHSILRQANNNSGILVRNIEITNVTYTKSAKSADEINKVIKENYGHVIPLVAKQLLKMGEEKVIEMLTEEMSIIIANEKRDGTYNPFTERASKMVAVVMVGVTLLSQILKMEFHKEEIRMFLAEHSLVKDIDTVQIGKRCMEFFVQFLSCNKAQFVWTTNADNVSKCRGRFQKTKATVLNTGETSNLKLFISDIEFEKILKEGKFNNKNIVLKQWREYGYLQSQKDRYVSRVRITDEIPINGYIILIPVEDAQIPKSEVYTQNHLEGFEIISDKEIEKIFEKEKNDDEQ